MRLFIFIVVDDWFANGRFLFSSKSVLVLASISFLLFIYFFVVLVLVFFIVLLLFVWRENGHINVQIWGISVSPLSHFVFLEWMHWCPDLEFLSFLFSFTSSLYLCCCCDGAMCAIFCLPSTNEHVLQVSTTKLI